MKNILYYEWMLFCRNRFAIAIWLFLLLAGAYALYYGNSFQQKQLNTITAIDTAYRNRIAKQIQNFSADTSTPEGKSAYINAHDPFMNEYDTHPVTFKSPGALQALSIGQSDNQPFYNDMRLHGDYIYASKQVELRNPEKLLSGNFDLAFVFIYLLPLLIIAYSYDVLSSDKETGIAAILLSQGIDLKKIVTARLLFRFSLAASLVLLLSIAGFVVNRVTPFSAVFYWLAISLLYITFWVSLVYAITALKKNSAITALTLISSWIFFIVLVPSFINNMDRQKNIEKIDMSNTERELSAHLRKLQKSNTMELPDMLFSVKPEWKQYFEKDTETVKSVAYSYLTMLHLNEKGRHIDSISLREQQYLSGYNYINPAYAAQQAFNRLAATESRDFAEYRKAAAAYQKQRSEAVHVLRLSDNSFTIDDFKNYPVFQQVKNVLTPYQFLLQVLPLVLLSMGCILAGRRLFKNTL